ncbi:ABC transporter permease [Roseobacteraceae bacterium NS-SX3]
MQALDLKLLRSFRQLWAQALAIALVLACGVAILLTAFGMQGSLEATRTAYYERNRFADVFARVNRAPAHLLEQVRGIAGVRAAEIRVEDYAVLDIAGKTEAVTGLAISLPETGAPRLNVPILRSGRLPDPDAPGEVAVNEPFARANKLGLGSRFRANLKGQQRDLVVTGTVLSPEFIYTLGPGALLPDNAAFGILWLPAKTMQAAYDMEGAFNSLSLTLDPAASEAEVIAALDTLLAPYGGLGAYGRDQQPSDSIIAAELEQLRDTAVILPPIFFGISAFLVNMVIGRIVLLERSEIGLLKALGYSSADVCLHYLLLALLIAVAGVLIGWAAGTWMSHGLAVLYAKFFEFPYLIFRMGIESYALSGVLALLTASLGAAQSAWRVGQLAPATAMAPPAPPRFRRGLLDRVLVWLRPSQPVLMILRGIVRWPLRAGLNVLGLSLAVAVLIASGFFGDALDEIMETNFYRANRQHATLIFQPGVPETALADVAALPGVLQAEGQLSHAAVLRNGHLEKDVSIEARRAGAGLARILDGSGRATEPPSAGLMLSERLAEILEAETGDTLEMELKGGRGETHLVPVTGIVTQFFGLGAYMELGSFNALLRQAPQITAANLMLDPEALPELHQVLKETPELGALSMMTDMRVSFRDTIRRNVIIMTTVYGVIAVLITAGVAYNSARIQLSERARELASLRILGFTRGEVFFILAGETMLLALIAQPVGWLLGSGIAALLAEASSNDLYSIPLVLRPSSYATASLVVLGAALAAVLIVRRRVNRLDLVQVMKTRE